MQEYPAVKCLFLTELQFSVLSPVPTQCWGHDVNRTGKLIQTESNSSFNRSYDMLQVNPEV